MTEAEIKAVVLRVLGGIAPEADLAGIDSQTSLRDQLDIDSVDFLNFIIGLHNELGLDIPDADAPRLGTIAACVSYLAARLNRPA